MCRETVRIVQCAQTSRTTTYDDYNVVQGGRIVTRRDRFLDTVFRDRARKCVSSSVNVFSCLVGGALLETVFDSIRIVLSSAQETRKKNYGNPSTKLSTKHTDDFLQNRISFSL